MSESVRDVNGANACAGCGKEFGGDNPAASIRFAWGVVKVCGKARRLYSYAASHVPREPCKLKMYAKMEACPVCGDEQCGNFPRPCSSCADLIRRAKEMKTPEVDRVAIRAHAAFYGPFQGSSRHGESLGNRLSELLAQAIALNGVVRTSHAWPDGNMYFGEVHPGKLTRTTSTGQVSVEAERHRIEAAMLILALVQEAVTEAYAKGREAGTDLLVSMAAGRMTLEELNRRSTGK